MSLEVRIERGWPGFRLSVELVAGDAPLALLGASGSGKTLTLRAIAGLERPERGRIVLNGRVLFDSATGVDVASRERRIGLVFQSFALFPHLSVAENVAFGLASCGAHERERRVREQLARVHLVGLDERHPHELSGGQQQRVALARALAPGPEALLLDEPLSALDTHLRSQMERQLIETLAGYRGAAILVSHNLEEAYRICRDLVVLDAGRPLAAGRCKEIFAHPPSLAVARVTGCKNFSAARALASGRIEALDWGCSLRVEQPPPARLGHVAIRAHHIEFADGPGENALPVWLAACSEAPFRMTLYLHLGRPPEGEGFHQLQAEVTKEKWAGLAERAQPLFVRLDPERLFLLPEAAPGGASS